VTLVASKIAPGTILAVFAAVAVVSATLIRPSHSFAVQFETATLASLCVSFLATLPGLFYFLEMFHRNDRLCEALPMFRLSLLWVLVGPVLLVASLRLSSWRLGPYLLIALRAVHIVAWLLGAAHTMGCAMLI